MGKSTATRRAGGRIAGKWQIPTLVLSLALLSFVWLTRPDPPLRAVVSPEEALGRLRSYAESDQLSNAVRLGEALLQSPQRYAIIAPSVHLLLARVKFAEQSRKAGNAAGGRQVEVHYRAAITGGQQPSADDFAKLAQASEWQQSYVAAADLHDAALLAGVGDRARVYRHLFALRRDRLRNPPEVLDALLEKALSDSASADPAFRLWALEKRLGLLDALGAISSAPDLLAAHAESFRETDLAPRFEYFQALIMYRTGARDQAEIALRALRDRVEPWDEVHAMSGWLLGRLLLGEEGPERPEEALSFFDDVLSYRPQGAYATASRIGRAEALAMLERHAEAVEAFEAIVRELADFQPAEPNSPDVLRITLSVLADAQRARGELQLALGYARTAASLAGQVDPEQLVALLQQLVMVQTLYANDLDRHAQELRHGDHDRAPSVVSTLRREAAKSCMRIVELSDQNRQRAMDSHWRAANLFAQAGDPVPAAGLYLEFAANYPGDPRVPGGLLAAGNLYLGQGRFDDAIGVLQDCHRRFPQTLDGARALIPLARAYMDNPTAPPELCERTLSLVLDSSDIFTPVAPEFATALFLRGELMNRRGADEQAISVLEEALDRYRGDPRATEAQYWLADSYRKSGEALKIGGVDAKLAGQIDYHQSESAARLDKARELYRAVINQWELRTDLSPRERTYFRLSVLYEADCAFVLQDYAAALAAYEGAISQFRDDIRALSVYVQIINCNVFLGQSTAARDAWDRANSLVDALPADSFVAPLSARSQSQWRAYFDWLQRAGLF